MLITRQAGRAPDCSLATMQLRPSRGRRCWRSPSCVMGANTPPRHPTPGAPFTVARPSSSQARKGGSKRGVRAFAGYEPFPFEEQSYYRVDFASEPYGPLMVGAPQTHLKCVLVFQQRDTPRPLQPTTPVMEVFVSGDACIGLYSLLQKQKAERPMALDILWQVLLRGQDLSTKNWSLLRVAIVDISGDIYHARMFFGDPETKAVMWDIDCRPSDATFLALKSMAPIYIKRSVWDRCALPLKDSASYEAVQMAKEHRKRAAAESAAQRAGSGQGGGGGGAAEAVDGINPEELMPVKLLKRELEVAVHEENYDVAARLRDHPWMRMCADIELHQSIGYHVEAKRLFHLLKQQIEAQESHDGEDYESKLIRQHKQQRGGAGSSASSAAQPDEIKTERKFD